MNVLVTGGSGFIGFHVASLLSAKGFQVKALVRDDSAASDLKKLGAEPVRGDIRDIRSVLNAVRGCSQVYHLAADYRLWVPDPRTMYEINVQGTRNVMQAALNASVEKVVYTSTVGVLSTSADGKPCNEESPGDISQMTGHYKKSKFIAEQEVSGFLKKGLPAVIVNPSTPVGPADRKPTPTGKIIVDFLNGQMPAYLDTGLNFVDVEDVAAGHLLAAEKGKVGQRYILGNRNMTLREFFECLANLTGKRAPTVRLPYLPLLIAAHVNEAIARVTRRQPVIPLTGVKMARNYMFFDSSKAVSELQMPQSPIERALERAIAWFRENGYIKKLVTT